ncbi:hypothetical protein BV25DRAFT_1827827 [Artomyces pyxidatus]|uniref:Uncharacterized protein n=1 Tax=Artomyces pyxidatus TaxID=48021 RepID=A0ACB8SW12_9AGAM|nr:hypothetical protein BV25DRAFT_1827827 [Artomyces pyxidatus]
MLSLSDDILLEILENYMEWKAIIACQRVCRRLESLVGACVLLQYTIELAACGMLDGERGPHTLPIHERLRRLKIHQEAWQNLTWTDRGDIAHLVDRISPLPVTGKTLVSLSNLDPTFPTAPTTVLLQIIPSLLRRMDESHSTIALPSFGSVRCDPAQDLCIFAELFGSVTSVSFPHLQLRFTAWFRDGTYHITSLSTGDAHPSANQGFVQLNGLKTVLDICGDYLLELHDTADFRTRVVVRNWKTGTVESSQIESHTQTGSNRNYGYRMQNASFLSESYILLDARASDLPEYAHTPRYPDPHSAMCLLIVPIRPGPEDAHSFIFFLPGYLQYKWKKGIPCWLDRVIPQCAQEPHPRGLFYANSEDRLISLRAIISNSDRFTIDIPVQTLTSYMRSHPGAPGTCVTVPWESWGPRGARITHESIVDPPWPAFEMSVNGMRRLSVSANAPCTVTVADYHPRRVARALARGDAAVAHGGSTHGMHTLLPCIQTRIPLPEDPARSLAAGQTLGAWLCDNGVVFMETRDGEITNAWAYTI